MLILCIVAAVSQAAVWICRPPAQHTLTQVVQRTLIWIRRTEGTPPILSGSCSQEQLRKPGSGSKLNLQCLVDCCYSVEVVIGATQYYMARCSDAR